MSTDTIRNALAQLDPSNDEHWTKGGHPAMAAVQALAADESITRAMIATVAPDLTRETAAAAVGTPPAPSPDVDPLEEVDHAALAASAPPDHVAEYKAPEPAVETGPATQPIADRAAELRAWIVQLRARKVEAESARVAAVDEAYRADKAIANAEAELVALDPPLTEVQRYQQFQARIQEGLRRKVEAANRAAPSRRSPLDEALSRKRRSVGR